MLPIIFFNMLVFLEPSIKNLCIAGDVSGIFSRTRNTVMEEYKLSIEDLKEKVLQTMKNIEKESLKIQAVLQSNYADAKNTTHAEIANLKEAMLQARKNARTSNIAIQSCISKQDLEISKLYSITMLHCCIPRNFSHIHNVKTGILKLYNTANTLCSTCILLHPFDQDIDQFENCIKSNIMNINSQINKARLELDEVSRQIINYSVQCLLETSSEIYKRIGEITGATKNCRNNQVTRIISLTNK